MAIPFPNPLNALTDQQLLDTLLTLDLGCGRAKGILKTKHRGRLCSLSQILVNECTNRGVAPPSPPYKA
jgi:hypothetical protein